LLKLRDYKGNIIFANPGGGVKELAEMMSGEIRSNIAVKHASDMLTRADKLNI